MKVVKIDKYLLIMAVFVLQIQIVWAEESESEMQKYTEMQKLLEMQKLMEIQKLLEMQKLLEKQKGSEIQNHSEVQKFVENGFNIKHYKHAEKLNLDVENYKNYRSNKNKRMKGNIIMGVGGGIATAGLLFISTGILTEPTKEGYYYSPYSTYDEYEEHFKEVRDGCLITGGICIATGLGLTIGGYVIRSRIREVVRKDGTKLSLLPKVNIFNNEYGAELSLSF